MSEWKEYKLGDFIKIKHGYAFSGEHITPIETDKILVTPGNFHIGGGFKSDKFKYYNSNDFPQEYMLHGGDIIVTMTDLSKDTDTLGYSAKVPNNISKLYLHNQRIGLLQFRSDKVYPDFVYWLMRTKEYQSYIVGSASGTSIMHTSPSRIEAYSFLFPPIEEQKRIAGVLSSLDDKIDLLNQENATLEALAETLFRHYFIENPDPTWKEGKLGDVCCYVTDKVDADGLDCHSYISTENMLNDKKGVTEASSIPDNIRVTKYIVGDVLISNIRPYFKKIWLADGNGGCSNDVLCIRAENKELEGFLYYTLRQDDFFDYVMLGSKGCKMPRGDKQHIMNWQISIPDNGALTIFNEQVSTVIKKIKSNQQQIQTLSTQRDTLLPRVMSGEVKVIGQ